MRTSLILINYNGLIIGDDALVFSHKFVFKQ